ncbi:hypothetical protein F503_00521 [Ophiostoma piceae UAMH 11346]|uniref:Uncharacterized protein n=1 Tax=Ophiostoma piceae (strain UAMH 11346) TaxID=1262450 RepID=S3C2R2_OPHP1|nr:hypothetical protein F503_00521 [Ophiostoma piceae UAMH 11346]
MTAGILVAVGHNYGTAGESPHAIGWLHYYTAKTRMSYNLAAAAGGSGSELTWESPGCSAEYMHEDEKQTSRTPNSLSEGQNASQKTDKAGGVLHVS